MDYLCWLSRDFLRWVRDDIILSQRLTGKNDSYWRQLVIVYLVRELLFDEFFQSLTNKLMEIQKIIPEIWPSKYYDLEGEVFKRLYAKTVSTVHQIT